MRLSEFEVSALIKVFSLYLGKAKGNLFLYGSRTDDDLKGGDIDLLLMVKTEKVEKKLSASSHKILNSIKEQIGDQKIDLIIASENKVKTDPFLVEIFKKLVLINSW